jgi:hypothetical protein
VTGKSVGLISFGETRITLNNKSHITIRTSDGFSGRFNERFTHGRVQWIFTDLITEDEIKFFRTSLNTFSVPSDHFHFCVLSWQASHLTSEIFLIYQFSLHFPNGLFRLFPCSQIDLSPDLPIFCSTVLPNSFAIVPCAFGIA